MMQECGEVCMKMKEELAIFEFLGQDEIQEVACYFEFRRATAGQTLWKEGDACDYLAFIASGRVEVKKETEFEGKEIVVGIYGRGTMVGELCILDKSPRAVTAVTLEDTSLVLLPHESLEKFLAEHPDLGVKFLKGMVVSVSRRLRQSFGRLAAIF